MNGTHVQSIARIKGLTYSRRRVAETLSLQGFRLLQKAARLLPVFLFRPLGMIIAFTQLLLFPRRAWAHQRNVKSALGTHSHNRFKRWALTMKALTSYGYFLLEYFKGHSLQGDRLLNSFKFEGLEEVDRALGRGHGVILAAVHLGNWWAGAAALASAGYKLHIVAGVQFTEALSAHAKAANESSGLRVVSPGAGQYKKLITALRSNEVIALPVDGDIFERGLEVPFFSGNVKAPAGPARLAAMTGAAVIACRVIRTAPLRFRFEFSTVWEGCEPHKRSKRDEARGPGEWRNPLSRRESVLAPDGEALGPPGPALTTEEDVAGPQHPTLTPWEHVAGSNDTSPTLGQGVAGPQEPALTTEEDVAGPQGQVLNPCDPGFARDLTAAIMSEQEPVIGDHLNQWCIFRDLWPDSGGTK